jgi:hypothetical protein
MCNEQIIETQQAKFYNSYKNAKLKLLKTNAAIWVNQVRKIKQLTPKYMNVKNTTKTA